MLLIHIPIDRCIRLTPRAGAPLPPVVLTKGKTSPSSVKIHNNRGSLIIASLFTALTVVGSAAGSIEQQDAQTLSNIPQTLTSDCKSSSPNDCKRLRIQRPKSRKAESCTIKCVTTCIRGGEGSPGEGPINIRRPLVVFKQGFRSRQYCLVECSDICNLIADGDGDDGP